MGGLPAGTAGGDCGSGALRAGNGPRSWPPSAISNIAISLLHLAGITEITRTLQRITRDRTRALLFLPL
jgi:hypothetical protein